MCPQVSESLEHYQLQAEEPDGEEAPSDPEERLVEHDPRFGEQPENPQHPTRGGHYQHLNRDLKSSLNDQTGPSPIGFLNTYTAMDKPPKDYSLLQHTPDLQLEAALFTKKVIDLKTIFSR